MAVRVHPIAVEDINLKAEERDFFFAVYDMAASESVEQADFLFNAKKLAEDLVEPEMLDSRLTLFVKSIMKDLKAHCEQGEKYKEQVKARKEQLITHFGVQSAPQCTLDGACDGEDDELEEGNTQGTPQERSLRTEGVRKRIKRPRLQHDSGQEALDPEQHGHATEAEEQPSVMSILKCRKIQAIISS